MLKKKAAQRLLAGTLAAALALSFPIAASAAPQDEDLEGQQAVAAVAAVAGEAAGNVAPDNVAPESAEEPVLSTTAVVEKAGDPAVDPNEPRFQNADVTAFVERLYEIVMERAPDTKGLNVQCKAILDGTPAGQIALNFFNSEEFVGRDLTNEERLEIVYKTMLDRGSDSGGKKFWMEKLDYGCSVGMLVAGFVESQEFIDNCAAWGVTPGKATELRKQLDPCDRNTAVTGFVQRLYKNVLNRMPDQHGLNVQCEALLNGYTAGQIALNFFWSPEFSDRGLSNEDRVETAYLTMLDRASDASGKRNWTDKLDWGCTMGAIVAGFVESPEFTKLCNTWGIARGNADELRNGLPTQDTNLKVAEFVGGFYKHVLGRPADERGAEGFVENLLSCTPPQDVAQVFFGSKEFKNRGLNNTEIVQAAYQALLGRDPSAGDISFWTGKLDSGMTVEQLVDGFCSTKEFEDRIDKYGLAVDPMVATVRNYIKNMDSRTNYLCALYLDSYTVNVFKGSAGNWKLVRQIPCGVGYGDYWQGSWWGRTFTGVWSLGSGRKSYDSSSYFSDAEFRSEGLRGARDPDPGSFDSFWWGCYWYSSTFYSQGCHTGSFPSSVGPERRVSHGCIRMAEQDAKYVYDLPADSKFVIWGSIYG